MGTYRSEDEALIGLARQLTDAYGEARRREDQDFACDSIADFLHEYGADAPSEALLAILDLPLTAETYPLVDEAQTLLSGSGPEVVGLLLKAVLGEVYDPDGPAPERAAETLDLMDRRDAVQGLVDVLCGRAADDVKGAAVDGLVALGSFAEPRLAAVLDDPRGGDWARAAIEQIRYQDEAPAGLEEYAAGEADVPDDAFEPAERDDTGEERPAVDAGDAEGEDEGGDLEEDALTEDDGGEDVSAAESGGQVPIPDETTTGPDQQSVDDAYAEFLRRFRQESGGDSSPS